MFTRLLLIALLIGGCHDSSQNSSFSSNNKNSTENIDNEKFNNIVSQLLEDEKYDEAYKLVKGKVESNDSNAENLMGILYLNGWGVEKNIDKSLMWFEKSIENDKNPSSYYHIAAIIMSKPDNERDLKKVFDFNSIAVKYKYPDSYNLQGILYLNGIYVKKEPKEAIKYFQEGAKLGSRSAQYNLAEIYEKGESIDVDLKKAFFWYESAHKQGNPLATIRLASMYADGKYVDKNIDKAIELLHPFINDFDVANYNFKLYCAKSNNKFCNS